MCYYFINKIIHNCVTHNASYYTALQQNRQNVAPSTHATTHILSKPPARPAPPSVGMLIVLNAVFLMGQFIFFFLKSKLLFNGLIKCSELNFK